MNDSSLNIAECIFFCYHSFAFIGDMKIEQEELDANSYFLSEWIGDNEEELQQVKTKTLQWADENVSNTSNEEFTGTLLSIVDHLKENFNEYQKEKFLMHIRLIAKADKEFHEQEQRLHDVFASVMGLKVRVSKSNVQQLKAVEESSERRPVGFRASWHP